MAGEDFLVKLLWVLRTSYSNYSAKENDLSLDEEEFQDFKDETGLDGDEATIKEYYKENSPPCGGLPLNAIP